MNEERRTTTEHQLLCNKCPQSTYLINGKVERRTITEHQLQLNKSPHIVNLFRATLWKYDEVQQITNNITTTMTHM